MKSKMNGIIELLIGETDNPLKDTWILQLPPELCDREGFARETLVSLTIKDHGITASFIRPPSKKSQGIAEEIINKNAAERFVDKYGDFMRDIQKLDE